MIRESPLWVYGLAYPVNWWLVVNNMKHGMLTIRPAVDSGAKHDGHKARGGHDDAEEYSDHGGGKRPGSGAVVVMTVITFVFLVAGLWLAGDFSARSPHNRAGRGRCNKMSDSCCHRCFYLDLFRHSE
jgi:hypothetical protein